MDEMQDPSKEKKGILLIDNNWFGRDTMQMALAEAGYKVVVSDEGNQAMERAKHMQRVDLIIIELSLNSGLDGFGFMTVVKDNPILKNVPILVLTTRDSRAEKEEAIKMGAVDCLVKYRLPPAELIKYVRMIIGD